MPPKTLRARPQDDEGLKARLVAAARNLLEREGLEAASLRATARRAGVSHMAPYRHFRDKDALLAAVAEQGFCAMTRFIDAAMAAGPTPHAAGLAYVSFALDNPALYRLMFGANLAPRARFPDLVAAGAEAFARCVGASGAMREAAPVRDFEAPAAAIARWSIVHGLATLVIDGLLAMPPAGPARDAAIMAILSASAAEGPKLTPS